MVYAANTMSSDITYVLGISSRRHNYTTINNTRIVSWDDIIVQKDHSRLPADLLAPLQQVVLGKRKMSCCLGCHEWHV